MDFNGVDDMNKYYEKHPEELLKQIIGQSVEAHCSVCNGNMEAKVLSEKELLCTKCNNKINVKDVTLNL